MPPHFPKNRHKARNAFMALKQKKGWECAGHKLSCQKKAEKCMCISAKTTVYIRMADLETGNTTILLSGLPLPMTFNPLPPISAIVRLEQQCPPSSPLSSSSAAAHTYTQQVCQEEGEKHEPATATIIHRNRGRGRQMSGGGEAPKHSPPKKGKECMPQTHSRSC